MKAKVFVCTFIELNFIFSFIKTCLLSKLESMNSYSFCEGIKCLMPRRTFKNTVNIKYEYGTPSQCDLRTEENSSLESVVLSCIRR